MVNSIFILDKPELEYDLAQKTNALSALENGQVIYLPNYTFRHACFSSILSTESILDGKHKNISYDLQKKSLGGLTENPKNPLLCSNLQSFMHAFAVHARQLVECLFPIYEAHLLWGRTSYRPAEIKGRASSKRKDDTRLHVDSFPATPVSGRRILRVFCNINPNDQPRKWHLGEPFTTVAEQFSPSLPAYNPRMAKLLKLLKITKNLRTAYDHYQLQLHDQMKLDDAYQTRVVKQEMDFKAQSSWIVFTDQVSHAALSGQYLLEQTFYLPVAAMNCPELSPLSYWEKTKMSSLILS